MKILGTDSGLERAEIASYHREWFPVLRELGVEQDRVWSVASALEWFGVRPKELHELVLEYERSGPGIPFPGFSKPGTVREVAMQLGAVRSKLHDLSLTHDNPRDERPLHLLPFASPGHDDEADGPYSELFVS